MKSRVPLAASSVELFGLPGSGKSSVEAMLTKSLQKSSLRTHSFRTLADFFRYFQDNPYRYRACWRAVRRLGYSPPFFGNPSESFPKLSPQIAHFQEATLDVVGKTIPGRVGRQNMTHWILSELQAFNAWIESGLSEENGNVLIADEAFLQRLAGIYATGALELAEFRSLLDLRPRFSIAVFLRIDTDESIRRKVHPPYHDDSLTHDMWDVRQKTAEGFDYIWESLATVEKISPDVATALRHIVASIESNLQATEV